MVWALGWVFFSKYNYFLSLTFSQTDEPNNFGSTALHMACYTGQDTVANELVNSGANINQLNHQGNTPLHLGAASSSGVLCLELLVNNGADVNVQVRCIRGELTQSPVCGIINMCLLFLYFCKTE